MNVRRFTGRNAREAMAQVRAAWGESAVVLSNRPVPGGVEILAMPGADVPAATARVPAEPMSTVSFQAFVRERQKDAAAAGQPVAAAATRARPAPRAAAREPAR